MSTIPLNPVAALSTKTSRKVLVRTLMSSGIGSMINSMAALLMASALMVLDVIGERNGRWYAEHLQSFSENAGRDDA